MSDLPRTPKEYSRRSWLSWIGKGTVISLGSASLLSCLTDVGPEPDGGTSSDGGNGGGDESPPPDGSYPFQPGGFDDPVYENWGERTVDRQTLGEILGNWRLRVDGMVEEPKEYSFADLVALPRQNQIVDFHCVEGWSILDVPWNGFHLRDLLNASRPLESASHLTFHTINSAYNESLPMDVATEDKTMLAYGIAEQTLPLKHGFPLRLVIPRLLAYKSAKYVQRIELTDEPIEGFWVARGYPYDAEVAESRLRPGKY